MEDAKEKQFQFFNNFGFSDDFLKIVFLDAYVGVLSQTHPMGVVFGEHIFVVEFLFYNRHGNEKCKIKTRFINDNANEALRLLVYDISTLGYDTVQELIDKINEVETFLEITDEAIE